jgi:hypothetical protein
MVGDEAQAGGHVKVWRDGTVRRVEMGGRITAAECADVISRAVELELEGPSTAMILDLSGTDEVVLSDDEIFRSVASLRRRFRWLPDFRSAVVAPGPALSHLVSEVVRTRELMSASESDVPVVRLFEGLPAADAWLADEI